MFPEKGDFINNILHNILRKKLRNSKVKINVETDEEVKFIRDYPQFKQLIESIIFMDENRNIVKVVPIDEYLEHHKI